MEQSLARSLVLGALIFAMVASAGYSGAVDRAAAGPDPTSPSAVRALERAPDGTWWVLEDHVNGGDPVVYQYSADLRPTGRAATLPTPPGERRMRFQPMDIAPAMNGDWLVLSENGTVFRYHANWTYAGDATQIPRGEEWIHRRQGYEFERSPTGWWVDYGDRLSHYSSDFSTIQSSYVGRTRPVWRLSGLDVDSDGTVFLKGRPDRTVTMFRPVDNRLPEQPSITFDAAAGPKQAVDLERAADGTGYLLSSDGMIHVYTAGWRYTGRTYRVGSGDALGYWPADMISPLILLVPLFEFVNWGYPLLIPLLGFGWAARRESGTDSTFDVGICFLIVVSYAFLYPPYAVRGLLVTSPVVLALGIAAVWGAIGRVAFRTDAPLASWLFAAIPVLYGSGTLALTLL